MKEAAAAVRFGERERGPASRQRQEEKERKAMESMSAASFPPLSQRPPAVSPICIPTCHLRLIFFFFLTN